MLLAVLSCNNYDAVKQIASVFWTVDYLTCRPPYLVGPMQMHKGHQGVTSEFVCNEELAVASADARLLPKNGWQMTLMLIPAAIFSRFSFNIHVGPSIGTGAHSYWVSRANCFGVGSPKGTRFRCGNWLGWNQGCLGCLMTLRKDSSVVSCQCIEMACSHSRSARQIP